MSFFIRKKGQSSDSFAKKGGAGRGRGRNASSNVKDAFQKKRRGFAGDQKDEEIPSDTDSEAEDLLGQKRKLPEQSSSDEEEETAQEKRLRLAKQYLSKLEGEVDDEDDDDDVDTVANRLKQDILEQQGRLQKSVASSYEPPDVHEIKVCRGHQLAVTCVVISPDDKHIYSGSKDCSIIKWTTTGQKVKVIPGGRKGTEEKHKGHTSTVCCLAITTDNRFLASGDKNKLIMIWNPETCELLKQLTGHRDIVSGLAFRRGTHQLFSASHDRTVKIWNIDVMAYVESLFGHHDNVTGVDSMTRERAVTCGGRDGSVRVWKVIEESQLIFHGHTGSIDCIALINEEHMVTGADDNSLALWSVMKKKPIVTVTNAHGADESQKNSENWISSVTSLCHTDLVASGSKDGQIRLWQCGDFFKSLQPLFSIPMPGFVNSLKFSSKGDFLVAGVGQEHRLGRWWRIKEAKNSVCIIPLKKKEAEAGVKPATRILRDNTMLPRGRKGGRK